MKTFKDYLNESKDETFDIQSLLNESSILTYSIYINEMSHKDLDIQFGDFR